MWACFDVLESALYRAANTKEFSADGFISPYEVNVMLDVSQVPTPIGRVTFDENRVNSNAKSIVVQVIPTSEISEIVAPTDVQTHPFVYPMPSWDERIYKWSLVKNSSNYAAIIIAGICTFALLAIIITICVHRKGMRCSIIN